MVVEVPVDRVRWDTFVTNSDPESSKSDMTMVLVVLTQSMMYYDYSAHFTLTLWSTFDMSCCNAKPES